MTAARRSDDESRDHNPTDPSPLPLRDLESWNVKELLTLEEAAKLLPGRPHASTLYRWAGRGSTGVRLRCVSAGHKRCTTHRWLKEFLVSVDEARRAKAGRGSLEEDAETSPLPRRRARTPRPAPARERRTSETLERFGLDVPANEACDRQSPEVGT